MPNTEIIVELARLWDRADPDTQWAMVQWTKKREHKIEWPLYPELLADYAADKRRADDNSHGGNSSGEPEHRALASAQHMHGTSARSDGMRLAMPRSTTPWDLPMR